MPKIIVRTPLGILSATPSADPEHPGISVDLAPMDGKGGEIPVSYVETDGRDPASATMSTRVWGDARTEDPTAGPIVHENLPRPADGWSPGTSQSKKLVYICSPYKGENMREREQNIQNARNYCMSAVAQGCVPYSAHLAICGFLDDSIPEERAVGIALDTAMMELCDELWVFGDRISSGMASEIAWFEEIGRPIRRFPA